jgi:hypothetical protein
MKTRAEAILGMVKALRKIRDDRVDCLMVPVSPLTWCRQCGNTVRTHADHAAGFPCAIASQALRDWEESTPLERDAGIVSEAVQAVCDGVAYHRVESGIALSVVRIVDTALTEPKP